MFITETRTTVAVEIENKLGILWSELVTNNEHIQITMRTRLLIKLRRILCEFDLDVDCTSISNQTITAALDCQLIETTLEGHDSD